MTDLSRCPWGVSPPEYREYHDREWGVPVHDDRLLFEFLVLEGAQAGLSWLTILRKRDRYRERFGGFEPSFVASLTEPEVTSLLQDKGLVRNRLKIRSAIDNARACLKVQKDFGSLNAFLWRFVEGKPIHNNWKRMEDMPAVTPASEAMSRALKARGFTFVGPTVCYALMQAVGMVNDHLVSCFRYQELLKDHL